MGTHQAVLKSAPRLLLTLTVFMALSLSMFAPVVSADTTSYTALQMETWLEDAISGTDVTVTGSPIVELTPASHLLKVTALSFAVRGVTVGLNELRVTCDGSKTVAVVGELDVLGKLPRFSCNLELEYLDSVDKLHVADISSIVIAGTFAPSLSESDIDTIVDVLNQILDSSELSVTSPGGDLTGIDVVDSGGAKLAATWTTGGPSYIDATGLAGKIDGMVNTLATKATAYLAAGEGQWTVDVNVVADASLDIDASFTAFGITAALSGFDVEFDTLTASIENATFSIGTGTKTVTFSAGGEIGCSGGVPSVAMASLTLGDEYPGLQSFIADVQEALLDAIDQAVDAIVTSTGLTWTFCPTSIAVVDTNVVLTSSGTATIDIRLLPGWSMVSVPVVPDDPAPTAVFAGAAAVYTWDPQAKSYVVPLAVVPEQGYWVYVTSDRTIQVTGAPVTEWQSQLLQGWNMVGSIYADSVLVQNLSDNPVNSIVRNAVYRWDPVLKSYIASTAVEPGKGYWMTTIRDCTLSMP